MSPTQSLVILGRQPAIGLAELESLYGAARVQPITGVPAALVDVDPCRLDFDRLGGSVKFCKLLVIRDTTHWRDIEKFLVQSAPEHAAAMPAGKMYLGLSAYGLAVSASQLTAGGLNIKQSIRRSTGRPVRIIPNQEPQLSSAQVYHNRLTTDHGWELVLIRHGAQTIIAQTVRVQDIDAYTLRDRGRPKRDARVGMLPPKLAQIIINLAAGPLPETAQRNVCELPAGSTAARGTPGITVLDPFCGTGVILQEAALMGYSVCGTDIDPRMALYAGINLEWLRTVTQSRTLPLADVAVADALSNHWPAGFDMIASEMYLGRPFAASPSPEVLARTEAECSRMLQTFLGNLAPQVRSGFRLCLGVPAWQTERTGGFRRLSALDRLESLGYNRVSFEHARERDMIYHRAGQTVARELVVLTKQ